jgi:lipoyl(octanoyl) transferase
MPTPFRFIDTGVQDAALNMAIDEAILTHYLAGSIPPTLRVFRWSHDSISLGRFQDVEREIEVERCSTQGISLVRRPTGGRAVYHRDEFTYSLVIGKREGVPSGVVAAYAYLLQGIQHALTALGIESVISEEHVSKNPSAACFASSTQADLTSHGYKIVGSAQVWKDDALLQQGSLPIVEHSADFFALLRFPSEESRQQALTQYLKKTTALHTLAPTATWNDIAHAFHHGFTTFLQHDFTPTQLTPSEWELARQLVNEKYKQLDWRKPRIHLIE